MYGTKVFPINPQQQIKLKQAAPPQYFYLRVMGLQIPKSQKQIKKDSNDEIQLKFQMGGKISKTNFKLQLKQQKYQLHPDWKRYIQGQTHLFSYEGEEILNIRMKRYTKLQKDAKKQNVKQKQKQKQQNKSSKNKQEKKQGFEISQQAFCRVPITSFILFPYTCHKIDAKLIKITNCDQFADQVVGILKFQLYYILKFEATLKIYPIQGHFQSVSPDLGQMNLCLAAKINTQRKKSKIDHQGGIHPKWHQYGIKQNKNIVKTIKGQQLYQDNCLQFKLESVGDILQLDIINFPLLDRDAEIVGSCKLKLENQDFFRLSNQPLLHVCSYKNLHMHVQDKDSKVFKSGEVKISYQFIYNVISLRKAIMGEDD